MVEVGLRQTENAEMGTTYGSHKIVQDRKELGSSHIMLNTHG